MKIMRNNWICGAVLTLAVLMAGCSKDEINMNAEVPDTSETVIFSLDAIETRTSLRDDKTIEWSEGDKVNVNGTPYMVRIDPETGNATIEVVKAQSYLAVYPAGNFAGMTEDGNAFKLNLPAEQKYVEGTFGDNYNPMVAYCTEGTNLQFHSICSVVKLSLKGNVSLDHIELTDSDGGVITGEFIFPIPSEGNKTATGGSGKTVSLTFLSYMQPQLDPETPTDFYIVIPANDGNNSLYKHGFVVTVFTSDGDKTVRVSADDSKVLANNVMTMPVFEVTPVEHTIYFKADDAAEWSTELPETASKSLHVKTAKGSYINLVMGKTISGWIGALTEPIEVDLSEAEYCSTTLATIWDSKAKKNIRSYILPKNTTTLAESWFSSNSYIERLVFPASLEALSYRVFRNCKKLSTLVFQTEIPPTITKGDAPFYQMGLDVEEANRTILVPSATAVEAYKAAPEWIYLVNGDEDMKCMKYNFKVGTGK